MEKLHVHVIHMLVYGNIEHQSETKGGGEGGRDVLLGTHPDAQYIQ